MPTMLRRATVSTWVDCFGGCGVSLPCRCPLPNKLCLVHGKYGSLCLGCLSHLVAGTLAEEETPC